MISFNITEYSCRHSIIVKWLLVLLSALVCMCCKKEAPAPGSASLTIVNAMPGSKPLSINFRNEGPVPYLTGRRLEYKLVEVLKAYSGPQRLRLFQYPDTANKDVPLFDLQLDLPIGSVNTLFLSGTVNAPDTLFTRDAIPFFAATDSAMAIRFVNLSPGSAPISINRKGLANGSEVSSIAYNTITGFNNYAATSNISKYVFEFRDAVSGDSITSYTIANINEPDIAAPNLRRYRSFTVALIGESGGTGNRVQTGFLVSH